MTAHEHHRDDDRHIPPREPRPAAITTPETILRGWWKNHTDREQTPTGDHTPPLAIVWWWDAISYGTDNWTDETEPADPAPSISIGWITHNTPQALTLVPLVNTNQWGNGITIPWGCIQHTTTITPPDTPRRRHRNKRTP